MNVLATLPHPFYEVNNKCDAPSPSLPFLFTVFSLLLSSVHAVRYFGPPFLFRFIVKNFEFEMFRMFKNFGFVKLNKKIKSSPQGARWGLARVRCPLFRMEARRSFNTILIEILWRLKLSADCAIFMQNVFNGTEKSLDHHHHSLLLNENLIFQIS